MTRSPAALTLPLPPPVAEPLAPESVLATITQSWHNLRQRFVCMSPGCSEHNGLRNFYRPQVRMQLQQGWCCGPECFQTAFELQARHHLRLAVPHVPRPHRIPLGLLLLSRNQISQEQLRAALDAQQAKGGRIGEWLVRQGAVSEDDITAGVALQWARPTFPLARSESWQQCRGWVPPALLEELRLLPLHFAPARRRLYVGFTQVVDATALAALGEMFECETEACLVSDSAFEAALEQIRASSGAADCQFVQLEDVETAAEIASTARQYARYAQARQVRLAAVGRFLWVRIRGEKIIHLTFRLRRSGR
jgi:hypothetical protein